ncbi:MAG TPA: hypothetical protein VGE74_16870 [Gemmata sp.]
MVDNSVPTREDMSMSQAPQPLPAGSAPASTPSGAEAPVPYRRVYAWVFQAWLVMFLGVICCALFFYLLSYIPKPK